MEEQVNKVFVCIFFFIQTQFIFMLVENQQRIHIIEEESFFHTVYAKACITFLIPHQAAEVLMNSGK